MQANPLHQHGRAVVFHLVCLVWIVASASSAWGHGQASAPGEADGDRTIVFPDTPGHQTLVVDLHTHSAFSDGHVWPNIRVGEALRDGLDAMAVTEHLEYQPHLADIPHPDRNRAYQVTLEAARGTQLLVIPGTEITRGDPAGHMNAIFISDANQIINVAKPPADPSDTRAYFEAADAWPVQNAVDAAHAQGAFIFWNHPYWTVETPDGIARITDFHRDNVRAGKLHGIEIANGRDYSAEAHEIALQHDLALIGVSDVHDLIDWDYPLHEAQHRPVNLVLAEAKTADALREALFAKRTLVWFRDLLIGRQAELDAMLQASLQVTGASYRPNTQVLDITVSNGSEVNFRLRNLTAMTFMDHAQHIAVPAHDSLTFSLKPGAALEQVTLKFAVENALLAPRKNATIVFNIQP
jgi:predicted metal-dependent phosphoesterase TrpH